MKKILAGLLLAVATSAAQADVFFNYNNNLWYGNVCRTGVYYSMVAFAPIGQSCWNYGWGIQGVISGS